MEILGKNGLGSFLKILLQIVLILGIGILVSFPFIIYYANPQINPNIVIFYPNAICLLVIVWQFIGLFDSLKKSNPFCENTVRRLGAASKASGVASVFWIFDLLYETFIVGIVTPFILVLGFMVILFIGVTIALYILAELFKQGLEYKNENDLTI